MSTRDAVHVPCGFPGSGLNGREGQLTNSQRHEGLTATALPHIQGLSAGLGDASLPPIPRAKDFWDFMGPVVITWGQHGSEVNWT